MPVGIISTFSGSNSHIPNPVFLLCGRPVECLDYIHYTLFPELESTMVGASIELRQPDIVEEKLSKIDAGNVIEEMKTFGKECRRFSFPYTLTHFNS